MANKTPGYKAVLVAEDAFRELKRIQSWRACSHLPVRFDLKDVVTALVEEALTVEGIEERVLRRALGNVARQLNQSS